MTARAHWPARLLVGAVVCGGTVLGLPSAAAAHPLGNFTVNRASALTVSPSAVSVEHVLDLAEVPTTARTPAIDASGDDRLSSSELQRWAAAACDDEASGLRLAVDGSPTTLRVRGSSAVLRPGQAGLRTLRLSCRLVADVSVDGSTALRFRDTGADGEVGWKEVTATGDGVRLVGSDVPARSASRLLTAYPSGLLTSPLAVTSATLTARPGGDRLAGGAAEALPTGVLARGADSLSTAFESLTTRTGGPLAVLVALLAALALGAAHAVAPGHGKTVMAFYLAGRQDGAARAAATVGVTVTATHTAGVLLIGLLVGTGSVLAPAAVYPWLTAASGLLVAALGLSLVRSARRGHPHGHPHPHGPHPVPAQHLHDHLHVVGRTGSRSTPQPAADHAAPAATDLLERSARDHHGHDHHGHDHHGHDHHTPATASRRGLVAMGVAGGLVPSPSALLVLLGATGLGHPWFGVGLVVAFGVGMATTLALAGLLVLRLRGRAEQRLLHRPGPRLAMALRVLPLVTAVAVSVLGLSILVRGLTGIL